MRRSTARLVPFAAAAFVLVACGRDARRDEDAVADTGMARPVLLMPPFTPGDSAGELTESDPPPPGTGDDAPPARSCDPNYRPCVPVDSDVDCAGGRGNGPSYVEGPVRGVGRDPDDLDRDGDGTGCEN